MPPKRIELLGVPVDCVDMSEAIDYVESMINGLNPCAILAVNPEKVVRAQQDDKLLKQLRNASLLIPDGIGVVFAVRLLGLGQLERVPGSELMPKLCEQASKKGYKVFLFGADQEVVLEAAQVLRQRYPGLNIIGFQHGYVKEEEMWSVVTAINRSQADLLFVALGSPQQELWMTRYLPVLKVKVCQGVGGTFDVIAGRVRRAPVAFRLLHLEWFYRLLSQPSRILRQTALPVFALRVLRKRFLG